MYVLFGTERTVPMSFGMGSVPSVAITPAGCSGHTADNRSALIAGRPSVRYPRAPPCL